ncbi:MAG: phosphate ABC transporter substrate-binding protein [Burkholderiaceae bacterium]
MSFLKRIQVCAAGAMLSLAFHANAAEVVPVVSVKSNVNGLSNNQVVDIFLGKSSRFPNGDPAIPIDQAEGSEIRDAFYMQFASKSAAQIKAYWSKIIFTGKGQPPRELSPSERVKRALAENPYHIGYIERSEVDENVRVVLLSR